MIIKKYKIEFENKTEKIDFALALVVLSLFLFSVVYTAVNMPMAYGSCDHQTGWYISPRGTRIPTC